MTVVVNHWLLVRPLNMLKSFRVSCEKIESQFMLPQFLIRMSSALLNCVASIRCTVAWLDLKILLQLWFYEVKHT